MKSQARVAVIGGGIAGVSCLYHLAKMGCSDAILLERTELTAGSTWHAAGHVPTYAGSWGLMRAGNYGYRLYSGLAEAVDYPINYHVTGAYWPAHTAERMELFAHLVGISKGLGYDLRIVSVEEMQAAHPYLEGAGLIGGIHDPYEGDIDPAQATQALAKGARDLGAAIERFAPVEAIARKADGAWQLSTPKGEVVCESLVNAAGYRGDEVAALLGQSLPLVTLEHAYLLTEEIPEIAQRSEKLPLLRDPDDCFYLRQERGGLLLGSYGEDPQVAWRDGIPADFGMELFPDRLEDIAPVVEAAIARVPLLAEAGIKQMVNGPIPYTPDAQGLVGPAEGLPGVYHCCGIQVGITQGPAAGKAIAELILEGETEWDNWAWDPRRFGHWATVDFAAERAAELYRNQYAIPYPHRLWQAGRPLQTTPLHETLAARGAVHGQIGGWERPLWFQRDGIRDDGRLSFHRGEEPWHGAVGAECRAVRDAVGVMDHGGFTRYEIGGPGAADFLDRMTCSRLPAVGRVRLAYFLSPKGGVLSEATICRLAEDRFLLCGPTLGDRRDFDWLRRHLPDDGSVELRYGSDWSGALLVMGPRARDLLSQLTDADLSNQAFPWMGLAEITLAGVSLLALRVSYVGELGWELHLPMADQPRVFAALAEAGQDIGLTDFGSYALNAMRLEKGYHGWQADFGPEFSVVDAGLGRFVAWDKPDFIGRDAALAQRAAGPKERFAAFEVAAETADALPDAPILKDGAVVGYVTSGGYGHRVEKSLALGYLRPELAEFGTEVEIEILGEARPARVVPTPVYDPENRRLKDLPADE